MSSTDRKKRKAKKNPPQLHKSLTKQAINNHNDI